MFLLQKEHYWARHATRSAIIYKENNFKTVLRESLLMTEDKFKKFLPQIFVKIKAFRDLVGGFFNKKQVKWKKYEENITYWDRVADGSKIIDTDYTVMCADADFIIPTAISKCAFFLKEHSEYSSANGLYFAHPNFNTYIKYDFAISELYKGKKSGFQSHWIQSFQSK